MFTRKAIFEFTKTDELDLEELELELIEDGLEEIEEDEGIVYVTGDFTAFGTLSAKMQEMNLDIKKAELQSIANDPVEFTEEQIEDIEKLIDKLEEDEDVESVYTNIA